MTLSKQREKLVEEFRKIRDTGVDEPMGLFYLRIEHLLTQALNDYTESIVGMLEKIEAEKWDDAVHCTCLGYAIHKLKEQTNDTK